MAYERYLQSIRVLRKFFETHHVRAVFKPVQRHENALREPNALNARGRLRLPNIEAARGTPDAGADFNHGGQQSYRPMRCRRTG